MSSGADYSAPACLDGGSDCEVARPNPLSAGLKESFSGVMGSYDESDSIGNPVMAHGERWGQLRPAADFIVLALGSCPYHVLCCH